MYIFFQFLFRCETMVFENRPPLLIFGLARYFYTASFIRNKYNLTWAFLGFMWALTQLAPSFFPETGCFFGASPVPFFNGFFVYPGSVFCEQSINPADLDMRSMWTAFPSQERCGAAQKTSGKVAPAPAPVQERAHTILVCMQRLQRLRWTVWTGRKFLTTHRIHMSGGMYDSRQEKLSTRSG